MNGHTVVHDRLGSPTAIRTPDSVGLSGVTGDHGRTAAVAGWLVGVIHGDTFRLPVAEVKSERIDG